MSETAIIAGVGPRIGAAVARELHATGARVGLFARSGSFVEELAADLGDRALAVPTDVTDPEAVREGTDAVREAFGPVSAVVCNAAAGAGRPVDEATVERLRDRFDVRVGGTLACVEAALSDLRRTEGSVVVSGTIYAEPPVTEQIEWGAVGPAARGLSVSLDAALETVDVTYVEIGSRVDPAGEAGPTALDAGTVAETYRDLIERDGASVRELELRR